MGMGAEEVLRCGRDGEMCIGGSERSSHGVSLVWLGGGGGDIV